MILEFAPPANGLWGRIYGWHLASVVPILGGLISGFPEAYRYLHSSIAHFKTQSQMIAMLEDAGLFDCKARALSGGIVSIYTAGKRGKAGGTPALSAACRSG